MTSKQRSEILSEVYRNLSRQVPGVMLETTKNNVRTIGVEGICKMRALYEIGLPHEAAHEMRARAPRCQYPITTISAICGGAIDWSEILWADIHEV